MLSTNSEIMADGFRIGPETARLHHRELVAEDAQDVFDFNGHPLVMKYTGEPLWKSLEETEQRLRDYTEFTRIGFGRWGCVYKPENKVIGFSGFKYIPELDEVDLGFRFHPEYWGHGLATESALACIEFGFERLNLKRIVALVLPENMASIRVLEKEGMHDDGIFQFEGKPTHKFIIEHSNWKIPSLS